MTLNLLRDYQAKTSKNNLKFLVAYSKVYETSKIGGENHKGQKISDIDVAFSPRPFYTTSSYQATLTGPKRPCHQQILFFTPKPFFEATTEKAFQRPWTCIFQA